MKKGLCTLLLSAVLLLPSASLAGTPGIPGTSVPADRSGAEQKATAKELKTGADRLKADKEYYKAANMLLEAAKLSGGAQKIGLRSEAANLFGWSGAHDRAKATYLSLIEEDPKNRGARLGLARIYSWTGNYSTAIREYETVLKESPGDSSALLGRARVWSWMGEYDRAIEDFSTILSSAPENNEAREAKARTLWWKGEHASSIGELDVILTNKPGNKKIKRLKRRIEWDAGRTLSVLTGRVSDSDSNDIRSLKASVYINHKRAGKLRLELTRYEVKRHSDTGHATVVSLKDALRLTDGVKLRSSLSAVSSKSGAASNSFITGGLSVDLKIKRKVRGIVSVSRSPYLDTTQLIRNNIKVTGYSGTLIYDKKRTTLSGSIRFNDFSDSNSSYSLRANIAHTIKTEPNYTVTVGYIPEYREFSKETFSGYYNPSKIFSNDLYVNIRGLTYNDRLVYNATATGGVQNTTKNEYTGALSLGATYYLKDNLTIEAEAKFSQSALATSTGFRSESYKAGLNYLF